MHPKARIGTALAAAAFVLTASPVLADETVDPSPAPAPTESATATPTETATPTATATTKEPEETPTEDTAPAPVLYIALTLPQATLEPGDDVTATVHVYATQAAAPAAKLALSVTGGVDLSPTCTLAAGVCSLGEVDAAGDFIPVRLSVPEDAADGTIRLTTTASATGAADRTVVHLLKVAEAAASPSPSPSQTTTATATPTATTTPTQTTPPPVAPLPATSTTTTVPSVTPGTVTVPGTTTDPAGGAVPDALPEVAAQTQTQPYAMTVSAIKPDPSSDPVLTSLVRAQAVWLSVLFVLVGLLFTRVRRTPAIARGTHRRPSKGRFAR
ncbi:hypothetical protein EDD29_7261 [Actinocorallia herbida]|uniref:Uncharacterized protein n=1 Tax=Actinocorallia herbida TaxID=58109 RepID=A0A3N1D7P1_9ACTN|nr:hypothetical protein [Actinocorallia herbida]ROO89563.1 hypothetical protein EDD29_7261 [Actinocorallia herbida]